MPMKIKELIGKEVIDAEAKVLGVVKDVEVDVKKWMINSIVVKTGFVRKSIILTDDIDKVGDKVVLKVTGNKIQKA
jgi:sporulation protein YlmC with PRC-barrel domain